MFLLVKHWQQSKDAIEVDVTQAQNNLQNAIIDNQRYENAYKTEV